MPRSPRNGHVPISGASAEAEASVIPFRPSQTFGELKLIEHCFPEHLEQCHNTSIWPHTTHVVRAK